MSLYTQRRKSQTPNTSSISHEPTKEISGNISHHTQGPTKRPLPPNPPDIDDDSTTQRKPSRKEQRKEQVEYFEINEDEYRKKGTALKIRIQHGRGRNISNQKKIVTIRPFIPEDADENIIIPDFTIEHTSTSLVRIDEGIKEGDFIYRTDMANGHVVWSKDEEKSALLQSEMKALLAQQIKKKRITFNVDRLMSENGLNLLYYDLPAWCQLKSASLPSPIGSTGILSVHVAEHNLHTFITYLAEWKKLIAPNSTSDDFIQKCQRFGAVGEVYGEAIRLTDLNLEKLREDHRIIQDIARKKHQQHMNQNQRLHGLSGHGMSLDRGEDSLDVITPMTTPAKVNPRMSKYSSILEDSDDERDYMEAFGSVKKPTQASTTTSSTTTTPSTPSQYTTRRSAVLGSTARTLFEHTDDAPQITNPDEDWFASLQQPGDDIPIPSTAWDIQQPHHLYQGTNTNQGDSIDTNSVNTATIDNPDDDLELELGLID